MLEYHFEISLEGIDAEYDPLASDDVCSNTTVNCGSLSLSIFTKRDCEGGVLVVTVGDLNLNCIVFIIDIFYKY